MLRFVWITVLMAAFLTGCQTPRSFHGMKIGENARLITAVPPVHQDQDVACGAAVVGALVYYYGGSFPPAGLSAEEFPPLDAPTSGKDLKNLAEACGLVAYTFKGETADIDTNISQGRPVIVMLPGIAYPRNSYLPGEVLADAVRNRLLNRTPHWVIVIGRRENGDVILHDPVAGRVMLDNDLFERRWKKMGQQTVLIAKPAPALDWNGPT